MEDLKLRLTIQLRACTLRILIYGFQICRKSLLPFETTTKSNKKFTKIISFRKYLQFVGLKGRFFSQWEQLLFNSSRLAAFGARWCQAFAGPRRETVRLGRVALQTLVFFTIGIHLQKVRPAYVPI